MKLKTAYIKNILISLLFVIIAEGGLFSQVRNKRESTLPKFYIGVSAGPSMNQIVNKGILSIADLKTNKKISYSGSIELGYFFSGNIGISTGIGYNSFDSELSLTSYSNKFNATDSENEPYERRITGSDIKESQNISYLSLPLCINFQVPVGSRFGFYFNTGINLSIPMSKDYSSGGTFSFSGYYTAYNVLLQNLPDYGFPENSPVNTNGNLELKSLNIEALAGAGLQLFISKKSQFAIGAVYGRSLSTISNYPAADQFQIASDIDRINSMMGGSSKAIAESIGLRLTFRYYIR
jgi:hypothetical protein